MSWEKHFLRQCRGEGENSRVPIRLKSVLIIHSQGIVGVVLFALSGSNFTAWYSLQKTLPALIFMASFVILLLICHGWLFVTV